VQELPDLASIQLGAARQAANAAKQETTSYEWPLSALIMSVCSLESFINQVAFFLIETNKGEDIGLGPYLSSQPTCSDFGKLSLQKMVGDRHALMRLFVATPFWTEFVNLIVVEINCSF
jgi:hypothetical protein